MLHTATTSTRVAHRFSGGGLESVCRSPRLAATRRGALCFVASVAFTLLSATGCATTTTGSGFRIDGRFRKDITRVSCFVDKQSPWLNFDRPPRDIPGGVRIVAYFTGGTDALGVFGDGNVVIDMYRIDRTSEQGEQAEHLLRKTFDTEHAYQFGFKKATRFGWGYLFLVGWGDIDVLDKEVMFIVSFERQDGSTIRGKRLYFKVPREA